MVTLLDLFVLLSFLEPVIVAGATGWFRLAYLGLLYGLLVGLVLGVGGSAGMLSFTRWIRRYPSPPPALRDFRRRLYDGTLFLVVLVWIFGLGVLSHIITTYLTPLPRA